MNKIEFKIVWKTDRVGQAGYHAVRIFIDDEDLIDILKEFEKPFAIKENSKSIAGSYEGIPPEDLYRNLTSESLYEDNKIAILECECGCEGCWDFLTEIKEDEHKIIWTNFENHHRGRKSHNFWDYSTFKDLTFDKSEYQKEIEKLKTVSRK